MPTFISEGGDWKKVSTTSSPNVEVELEKEPDEASKPKKTVKKSTKKEASNA